MTALKRRIIGTALVLLALWPLAHRVLVARYRLNPWLFFGWAMYVTPRFAVEVVVAGLSDGEIRYPDLAQQLPALRQELRAAARDREAFGLLESFDELARAALREASTRPELGVDGVIVRARQPYLDPRSDRVAAHDEYWGWLFTREGIVGPTALPPPA